MNQTAKQFLFSKQKQAMRYLLDPTWQGEIVYGGGARGGKSQLGSIWLTAGALCYPESQWLIGFEELKHLRRTTLPDLLKIIKNIISQTAGDNWRQSFKLNQQDMIIEFINGSKIFLAELAELPSDPEFDRLGSYGLTGLWIDEAQRVSAKAKSTLSARLSLVKTDKWQTKPKALYTCNPTKNWIYSEFYKPLIKEKQKIDSKVFIQSLYTDNPFIDHKSYKKQVLASESKVQIERLLYGNFDYDDDPSRLMEYDSILNLWNNEFVPTGEKYITADIALQGSDKLVIRVWSGLRVILTIVEKKSDSKNIEHKIRTLSILHDVPRSHICFDADGVGAYLGSYLDGAKAFHNGAKALNNENYDNLKTQCYFKLADYINQHLIYISDQKYKKETIEELEHLKQRDIDKDGKIKLITKDKIKEIIGRSPDFADSLMLRMFFELNKNKTVGFKKKVAMTSF